MSVNQIFSQALGEVMVHLGPNIFASFGEVMAHCGEYPSVYTYKIIYTVDNHKTWKMHCQNSTTRKWIFRDPFSWIFSCSIHYIISLRYTNRVHFIGTLKRLSSTHKRFSKPSNIPLAVCYNIQIWSMHILMWFCQIHNITRSNIYPNLLLH